MIFAAALPRCALPFSSMLFFWASSSVCHGLASSSDNSLQSFLSNSVKWNQKVSSVASAPYVDKQQQHSTAVEASRLTCSCSLTYSHLLLLCLFLSSVPVVKTWWRSPWTCLCAACSRIAMSCGSRAKTLQCWTTLRPLSSTAPN